MKDVRVVILAGGKGTRLRPYTAVLPKPLMPIGDLPILEIVLRQLKHFGFEEITLSVSHMADLLNTFFGDGSKLGVRISYCFEDEPLGTAGCISLVEDLTEYFLVMNGDLLTTLDYAALVQQHVDSGATATIAAFPREVMIDLGVLEADDGGALVDYREKPRLEYLVSMGINVFDRSVVEFVPRGQFLDIPTLMMRLVEAGRKVLIHRADCDWLDIGRPEDYDRATIEFEKSASKYLRSGS